MQNINEVVGIIKGINFDGVINQKEIEFLQSWTNDNRHFAITLNQRKLMTLIEEALDDKVLSDSERRNILVTAQSILKLQGDESTIFTELNGIIEGIISDNEVNKEEILNLKKWYDLHEDSIKKSETGLLVKNALNKILEDGIITVFEQNYLLSLLKEKIGSLKINARINYLKKQVKQKKNIGIDLIDLLDENNNMNYIHAMAESELERTLNSDRGVLIYDPEIVVISLSLIAMLNYNGSFYSSVRLTYKDLYSKFSEQKIEGLIRTILNKYRTKDDASTRARIINVPLRQAIVPKYFLANFFEFIYDIYKLNFEYDLSRDLYEDFLFVYDGLKSNMKEESDELKVNTTQKSYKLIQTTKDLVTKENNIEPLIKLSIIIVQLIDKQVWGEEIIVNNNYLKEAFENWRSSFDEKEKLKQSRKKPLWRSSWKPKLYLHNDSVVLQPPTHKIKSQYNYRDIRVIVKNDEQIIYENQRPDVREIIGGYQINIPQIKIECPLGKLKYFLMIKNTVIYDTNDHLYRDFIVFDQDGNELTNNTEYNGTALFCTKNPLKKTQQFYNCDKYVLASANIHSGDVFFIEDKIFNFTSLTKPGVFGEKINNHTIVELNSGKQYPVYENIKYLVFEDEISNCIYEIIINNKSYQLTNFNYTNISRDGVVRYIVDLNIVDPNIYTISVNRIQTKKINVCTFNLAYDSKFMTETVKIDDKTYVVTVSSGLTPSKIIKHIDIECFDIDDIQFTINNKTYSYRIPLSLAMYRISSDTWKPITEDLWIDDIKPGTLLDIYGQYIEGIMVISSKGNKLDEFIQAKNKGVYSELSLGFLTSYKSLYDYTSLFLLRDQKVINFIRCNNKCIIDDNGIETIFDPVKSELFITTHFKGKGSIFYEILDVHHRVVCKSVSKNNAETARFKNLKSFEQYTINIYEKKSGLMLGASKPLKTMQRTFYARKDFIGKKFKITEAYYSKKVGNMLIEQVCDFNKNYVQFTEQIGENTFRGQVYSKTYKGIYWLYKLNPVEIEMNSDVISKTMDLYITNEGDGLLLDLKHHRIMNDLDNPTAPCIETYTININEEDK